jgi:hypothetical protein
MKTKHMLLVAGGLSAIVLVAGGLSGIALSAQTAPPPIDHRPLVVTDLGGTLRLIQAVPCNQVVDVTTAVAGGRAELTPSEGIPIARTGGKTFTMVSLTLLYEPFRAVGDCEGFRDSHKVSEIGVRLAGAVTFDVAPNGDFTIPKGQFLIHESFVDNKTAKTAYQKPSEDVTGNLDLIGGTMSLRIVIGTQLLFRAGCDSRGENCAINTVKDGTQSSDVRGTLVFPDSDGDKVPDRSDSCPFTVNVSCTALKGREFLVSAAEACGASSLHLGDFSVRSGEVIQIEETGKPGVRFVGTAGRNQIRRFQVGKGQAIVVGSDGSSAMCGK